jgi:hypothetical protein
VGTASTAERALLDWHMANLECAAHTHMTHAYALCAPRHEISPLTRAPAARRYANAGLLATLSLGQWDQDDYWEVRPQNPHAHDCVHAHVLDP